MKFLPIVILSSFIASLGAAAQGAGSPSGDGIVPTVLSGHSDCHGSGSGYIFGFRLDESFNGTFTLESTSGDLTGGAPEDSARSITISTTQTSLGTTVDWSATFGIDAVVVRGGPSRNVYAYPSEDNGDGDTGLHTPVNPNGSRGKYYGLGFIEFCYDYEPKVSKTAAATFTRTFNWTIDKSVQPATWDLVTGNSGTSTYTVQVAKTGSTDGAWAVDGEITIENDTPVNFDLRTVIDKVSGIAIPLTVDCGVGITFPRQLLTRDSLICSYSGDLPDGIDRTNTATLTFDNDRTVGADALVDFGEPTKRVNDSVTVTDTFKDDPLGTFDDTGSTSYDRTFTCDTDAGTHGNTATIEETNQSASASVTVNCQSRSGGCTLGFGYWKTHSTHGPASHDDNWNQIDEDAPFFKSGQSYYEVLWTTPSSGNAYYILAHQYIAAELNLLGSAASTTPVDEAIAFAETFFGTKTPTSTLSASQRNDAIQYASTLNDYNSGVTGPGQCE